MTRSRQEIHILSFSTALYFSLCLQACTLIQATEARFFPPPNLDPQQADISWISVRGILPIRACFGRNITSLRRMRFQVGPLSIFNENYILQDKFAPFVKNDHKYIPLNYVEIYILKMYGVSLMYIYAHVRNCLFICVIRFLLINNLGYSLS